MTRHYGSFGGVDVRRDGPILILSGEEWQTDVPIPAVTSIDVEYCGNEGTFRVHAHGTAVWRADIGPGWPFSRGEIKCIGQAITDAVRDYFVTSSVPDRNFITSDQHDEWKAR